MKGKGKIIAIVAAVVVAIVVAVVAGVAVSHKNSKSDVADKQVAKKSAESHDVIPEEYKYSLTVSINPLVELYFDDADVVVGIAYLNEDAYEAYKDAKIVGCSFNDGVSRLIVAASDKGYLKDDGKVEIELSKIGSDKKEVSTEVLTEANKVVSSTLTSIGDKAPANVKVETAVAKSVENSKALKVPKKCPVCNGTGNSCKECNGTGDVRCKRCNNGVESCGTCHGSAKIKCHGCHGSGINGPNGETCNYCGGSGIMSCDACHGRGTFTCSWCKGALHHVCPDCWGKGSCSNCGGTGVV